MIVAPAAYFKTLAARKMSVAQACDWRTCNLVQRMAVERVIPASTHGKTMNLFRLSVLIVLASATPGLAQIPEKFENLKVLPKTISRPELVTIMRGFTSALGVRCQYCHVYKDGTNPDDLANFDFKADDKPTKDKARFMWRMVGIINDTILTRLDKRAEPAVNVNCVTCHRGSALPRPLESVLAQTIRTQGTDSAIAQYRRLRATVLPLGRYNFGENTLSELARQLVVAGQDADAIRMLELNEEQFPASANISYQIGEIHRNRGETDKAVARYRKALELDKNHMPAQRRLKEMGQS